MNHTAQNRAALLALLTGGEERLADLIAGLIVQKLQTAGLVPADGVYTSNALPPDVRTKERFHRLVRDVEGARRDGRCWIVPRSSWEAYRTRCRSEARSVTPLPPTTDDAVADELLSAAGFRPSLRLVGGTK